MTTKSTKFPALARAQEWLAAHGDPLPEPGTRPHQPAKDKSRAVTHQPLATNHSPLDLSRHERRCSVCQHPERDAIEEAFLDWRPITRITSEFKLPGRTSIYRHAHAFGLFPQRSRNLRFALGLVIEKAEYVTATAEGIVSAVRAYARVTDAGEWVEPPSHVIVSSGSAISRQRDEYALPPSPAPHASPLSLTATQVETENDATH